MTVTAAHGRERLVVQIMSADKPVITVITIPNVAQENRVVMTATVL